MAEGSGAGQFFTPGSVVRLLVEMIEPLKGRIMDLACGSGGMFVQSLKFGLAHGGDKNDICIYGQERYEGTLRLCKMNLLLRNLSFDVKLGDSLLQDRFPRPESRLRPHEPALKHLQLAPRTAARQRPAFVRRQRQLYHPRQRQLHVVPDAVAPPLRTRHGRRGNGQRRHDHRERRRKERARIHDPATAW